MKTRIDLSPQNIISAYTQGIFPMGNARGEVKWYEADPRGILPLDAFHIPHDLRRILRQGRFHVTLNHAFTDVITLCATTRPQTWISDEIIEAYSTLHQRGYAHSVETWQNGELVGGLYGVAIGAAFFGESMFHHKRDASKVALAHLGQWLIAADFLLFDIQMVTDLLRRFGAILVQKPIYMRHLERAVRLQRELKAVPVQW